MIRANIAAKGVCGTVAQMDQAYYQSVADVYMIAGCLALMAERRGPSAPQQDRAEIAAIERICAAIIERGPPQYSHVLAHVASRESVKRQLFGDKGY